MKWKLTQSVIGEPVIDVIRDTERHEDLTLGYSLLRALAASDDTLIEISPGVWRQSKGQVPHVQGERLTFNDLWDMDLEGLKQVASVMRVPVEGIEKPDLMILILRTQEDRSMTGFSSGE